MRRSIAGLALILLLLLAAMAAKGLLTAPPPVRSASAPGQFDAMRAKARLAQLLGDEKPHPTDSPANDAVRERLIAQLVAMGLKPVVRDQFACNELYKQRGVSCARVRNVITLIGPARGKALLLNAHYDSTPSGPGAGDDGIGVATLLEVASILKDQPLQRPVMLLFNEGEELGLVGARAFLSDPSSTRVDSLINLEARGVRGPVNMFETSRPNAGAIRIFAEAVKRPVANSLATDVYRLMPNYTDVNSFAERRWLTLNLAPVGNETRYHSPGDTVAALDPATLQHMGDQTLALAQQLAAVPPASASGERIFMDVAGRAFINLPLGAGVALLAALLIAFALVALRRGRLGRGVAVAAGTLASSAALSWLMLALLGAFGHGMFWRAYPVWTTTSVYATVTFASVVLLGTIGRAASVTQLRAAFWLIYLAVGALIGLFAPGGIIFFLFPPLLVLAGMLVGRWWRRAETVGAAAATLLLYLTWGSMLGLLEELLNAGPMWIFAPLGSLLILPVMIEAKPLIDRLGLRTGAIIAGTLAIIGWAVVAAVPAYSADRQQRFTIEHVTDADRGGAQWSILNGGAPLPRAMTSKLPWRRGKLPHMNSERWLAPAPRLQILPPDIVPLGEQHHGEERVIAFALNTNGAERMALVMPPNARVSRAGTSDFFRPIDRESTTGDYVLTCSGRACDGEVFQLWTTAPKPLAVTLVGLRSGLPSSAAQLIHARPRFARPQYAPDETIAFKRVKL